MKRIPLFLWIVTTALTTTVASITLPSLYASAAEARKAPPSSAQADRPKTIAHRGASAVAPENTLASFRQAWQLGADGIEGDFYLTRDGHIVCLHDKSTKRVADKDLVVAESSLADLRKLDVGSWKGNPWRGERIPTLREVLAEVPAGKRIYLEIKCGPEIVPSLAQALADCQLLPMQTVIISFNEAVIAQCKATMPQRQAFWLANLKPDKKTGKVRYTVDQVVQKLRQTQADGAGVNRVTAALAQAVHAAGKELHIWTINNAEEVPGLVALGVGSITTDRPGLIRQAIERASQQLVR